MEMEMKKAIEIKNVSKKYEGFTLDNINLELPKGYIMGIVGENGAGKSTTIKLIMNAIKMDNGEINVLGVNNKEPEFNQIKEDIGVVLDEAYFPEVITPKVVNDIMEKTYKKWDRKCFYEFMDKFNLPLNKKFKEFSRGMKMKLAIAVAMSHDPKLLILDEATSGLDPIVRDEILDIFYDFTREPEHSILMSSHIVSDLEKLCDYIAFIHKGKLLFSEPKDTLIEEYGLIKCSVADFDDVPKEAICGVRRGAYGVSAMVKKSKIAQTFDVEKINIEDIILYMAKGEK